MEMVVADKHTRGIPVPRQRADPMPGIERRLREFAGRFRQVRVI